MRAPIASSTRDVGREMFELRDPTTEQPQRSVDSGREPGDLLRDPDVVPADQLGHHPLDYAEGRAVRSDRDDRIDDDEILGPFERGLEVVAHLGGSEAIEELIELALEAGRVFARRPAGAHLRLDFGGKLVDVDVVVGQDRPPIPDSIARRASSLRHATRAAWPLPTVRDRSAAVVSAVVAICRYL